MKRTNLLLAIIAVVIFTTGSLMALPNIDNEPDGEKTLKKEKVKVVNNVNIETTIDDFAIGIGHEDLEGDDQKFMPPPSPDFELKPTNIETKLELKELSIYPNPSNGKITLDISSDSKEPLLIEIYGIDGKVIYSEKINSIKDLKAIMIDLSREHSGFYFVNIIQGEKKLVEKIIIK